MLDLRFGYVSLNFDVRMLLLKTAEMEGAVCRDDSVQGLRFYVNRFLL